MNSCMGGRNAVRGQGLWLLLVLACAGCGGDDEASGFVSARSTGLVGGCDIRQERCQQQIFERTAELRGQAAASPPEVRTLGVDAVTEEFAQLVAEDDPGAERSALEAALQLLGLISGAVPLDDAVVDTAVENVGAYYDDQTGRITVVDRGQPDDPEQDTFLLAHELVHALQDQRGQLTEFHDQWVDSTDSELAITTLIEGEATVLAAALLDSIQPPGRFLDWGRFTEGLYTDVFDSIEAADEPFLASLMLLPYALGTRELAPLWRADGQTAIDAEYEDPRLTTLEWSGHAGSDTTPESLDCYPTTPPDGYEPLLHDRFGMAALLAEAIGGGDTASEGWVTAQGWRDDSVVVFTSPEDAEAVAVAWRIRFGDSQRAEAFATAWHQLGLGPQAVTDARDVIVYGATDAAVADGWSDVTVCGTRDSLPEEDTPAQPMTTSVAAAPRTPALSVAASPRIRASSLPSSAQ